MGGSFSHGPPVGRAREIALVDTVLQSVLAGAGAPDPMPWAVLVGGDAGIGKTTLVELVCDRAEEHAVAHGVGHCLDLSTGTPFAPVAEALRDVASHRQGRLAGPDGVGAHSGPHSTTSVLDAVETLGRGGPFVLVIEDLHWADASVRDFTLAALNTCRAPALLVLTFRSDDVTGVHPLRPVLVELTRSARTLRLDLDGLSADDVGELIRRRTGRDPEPDALRSLVARSDGNPLHVEELLATDEPGLPRLLDDLLLRHVKQLTPLASGLARLASVDGSRIDVDVLRDACGLGEPAFGDALRELLDANVVLRQGDRFTFRHALLREAVLGDLLPAERRRLHARYAAALRARDGTGSTEERWAYATSLSHHAAAAEDWPLALEASVRAGEAGQQLGSAVAADHFERAGDLWGRVPDASALTGLSRADLPRLAARVLANEGDRARVHALLREAVTRLEPEGDALAACRVYTAVGESWDEVPGLLPRQEALAKAVELAGSTPSRELVEALDAVTFHACRVGRFREALPTARRAVAVARGLGAEDLVAESLWELTGALWDLGHLAEAVDVHREAVRTAERSGELRTTLEASGELAASLAVCGLTDEAVAVARQVRASAAAAGLTRFVAFGAEQEVEILVRQGRLDEAEDLFETCCVPAGLEHRLRWLRSELRLARGDARGALDVEEAAFAHGANVPGAQHSPRLIAIREALDDPVGALVAAEALLEAVSDRDSPLEHAVAAGSAFRALALASGHRVDAPPALALDARRSLDLAVALLTADWAESWYAVQLALGLAFAAQVDGDAGVTEWEAAARLAAPFGRYAALRPRLELARARLSHGDRENGKELLVEAWHEADLVGARWLLAQAELAARRHRVPLPRSGEAPSALARLTSREREVLELVATGATNRAIASRLFITEKTASVHVGSVIAKLGVANRGEAAALFRASHPADPEG